MTDKQYSDVFILKDMNPFLYIFYMQACILVVLDIRCVMFYQGSRDKKWKE